MNAQKSPLAAGYQNNELQADYTQPLARVLGLLQGVKSLSNGKYLAKCPAHGDKTPSLSIAEGNDGRVLLHCLAGCDTSEVLAALGLEYRDLYPPRPGYKSASRTAERAAKEEAEIAREAEETRRNEAAAIESIAILAAASGDPAQHPYAMKKDGVPFGPLVKRGTWPQRGWVDALLIPIYGADGRVWSLQAINTDGEKDYLKGGRKRGGFHPFGNIRGAGRVLIGEGLATVAAVHAVDGSPAAAAMDAGSLAHVAQAVRKLAASDAELVFLADNDVKPDGSNPGLKAAMAAAALVGGRVAIPELDGRECDFWDVWHERGPDAVARAIANATAIPAIPATTTQARGEHHLGDDDAPAGDYARDVSLIRASDVIPEPINWLWNGYLAAGKPHILGGAPGTGKTTIALDLAATVSTGGRWPDGTHTSTGNVVIWSGEDDPADTLVPRLALSGADLSRVYFIADIREGNEQRSFDPARDMEPLRRKLAEIGDVRLLVIDPIVSAIAGDSHKNAEVRRGLQPLVDLARTMHCALLGITHFSKGTSGRDPVERITGSLAFGALARVVLVAAKHQKEGGDGRAVRLFCRAKSNIGLDDDGFEYDLHQAELKTHPGIFASSVRWGEAVRGAAHELLAVAEATGDGGESGTLADAKQFLSDLLADGPLPVNTIKADVADAGYSWATIRRAQKALRIKPEKPGMKAGWVWRMPGHESALAIMATAEEKNAVAAPSEDRQKEAADESGKQVKKAEGDQKNQRCSRNPYMENVSTFRKFDHLQQNDGKKRGDHPDRDWKFFAGAWWQSGAIDLGGLPYVEREALVDYLVKMRTKESTARGYVKPGATKGLVTTLLADGTIEARDDGWVVVNEHLAGDLIRRRADSRSDADDEGEVTI